MDKFEIRRINLQSVLMTHCNGKAAALADKIGRAPSYVSRMLYPEGKAGKKRIGEDMRNLIEDALSLPRGALDDEAGATANLGSAGATVETTEIAQNSAPTKHTPVEVPSIDTTIERFSPDERKLIDLYRQANKDGRLIILGAATVAPKGDWRLMSSAGETMLGPVNAQEKRVLELYRQASKDGKAVINGAAAIAPRDERSGAVSNTD